MTTAELSEKLKAQFATGIVSTTLDAVDPWIEVSADALVAICRFLRDQPDLRFDLCNCITVVDYFHTDPKKAAKAGWEPHLEILYHLSSTVHKHRMVLKLKTPRWKDGEPGRLPDVPTVTGTWKTALWHERELYDLSGVWFVGHPDLRRILCPEDWVGHPLRKDYEMPLEYHGIRGR
jgi:NADH-quinone oxidoreductase subunit C